MGNNQYKIITITESGVLDSYDVNDINSIIHSKVVNQNIHLNFNSSIGNEDNQFQLKKKCALKYIGVAEDKTSSGKERQMCFGQLLIQDLFTNENLKDQNGIELVFEAISGPGVNGLLPNGEYFVTSDEEIPKAPPYAGEFPDENGFSFKMRLKPQPKFQQYKSFRPRSGLLIHPIQSIYDQEPAPPNYTTYDKVYFGNKNPISDGCIGLCESWELTQKFYYLIQPYLIKNKVIKLHVDVDGNHNLKNHIGNSPTYKNIYE